MLCLKICSVNYVRQGIKCWNKLHRNGNLTHDDVKTSQITDLQTSCFIQEKNNIMKTALLILYSKSVNVSQKKNELKYL
jgi:hypothetical protein